MPERLVLTNIHVLAIFNYQRYTTHTTKQVHLIEFLEPTFYLKISIYFWGVSSFYYIILSYLKIGTRQEESISQQS